MALLGSFVPKPNTILAMPTIRKQPKAKPMIICAAPPKPGTSSGSGGQINSTLRVSTRSLGVDAQKLVITSSNLDIAADDDTSTTSDEIITTAASPLVEALEAMTTEASN